MSSSIYLNITNKCNQRCLFCFNDFHRFGGMDLDRIKASVKEGFDNGGKELQLTGGEPTLHPNIIDIVRYSRALGINNVVVMTNGLLFCYDSFTKNMREAGLTNAVVSLNAHNEVLSDRLTSTPGSFEKTVRGIRNLLSVGVNVDVTFVINKLNIGTIAEFGKFIKKEFDNNLTVHFNFVRPQGNAIINKEKILIPFRNLPNFHDSIQFLVDNDIAFCFSGCSVPLCMIGNFITYSDDFKSYLSNRTYIRNLLDEKGELGFEKLSRSFLEGKVKGDQCKDCVVNGICTGIWKDYADYYGFGDLRCVRQLPPSLEEYKIY